MKKLADKCGVCLREHVLDAKWALPRHGWTVEDLGHGHGQEGGHHVGACPGWEKPFPRLGESVAGAQWRLDQLVQQHKAIEDNIAYFMGCPPTISYTAEYSVYAGGYKRERKFARFTIERGQPHRYEKIEGYAHEVTVPSYDRHRERLVHEQESLLNIVKGTIAIYEAVVESWKPYEPYLIDVRVEVLHKGMPWRRHERMVELGQLAADKVAVVPACARFRSSRASSAIAATDDEVNCKRCQKLLGAGVKEKDSVGGTRHIRPIK